MSKIGGDRVKTGPLVFEGVNLKWALKYVALALKDREREQRHLEHLILGPMGKETKKPIVRTKEKLCRRKYSTNFYLQDILATSLHTYIPLFTARAP